MGFAVTTLLLASVVLVIAGFLRGITGFGLLLIATPLLFEWFPPKVVIAALIIPTSIVNIGILWHDMPPWEHLRSHLWLYYSGAIGGVIGVVGLIVLHQDTILVVVAGYIGVFLLVQYWGTIANRVAATRGMSILAGGSGGLLGGTIGLAGPPVITYLHAKSVETQSFVGLLAGYFLLLGLVRLPTMGAVGLFGRQELVLGLIFTVPTIVGAYLGAEVRPRIPRRYFELGVEGFLVLLAVNLVNDALSLWP